MGKVKTYDKNIYPCIRDAIYEIMDEHLLVMGANSIYHGNALRDVCFFLAENNIQHEYIIIDAPLGAECDQIISLVWMEPGAVGNEVWYSRGEAFPKTHYRVTAIVVADSEEEVENWITNAEEIEVCDWSMEEL